MGTNSFGWSESLEILWTFMMRISQANAIHQIKINIGAEMYSS